MQPQVTEALGTLRNGTQGRIDKVESDRSQLQTEMDTISGLEAGISEGERLAEEKGFNEGLKQAGQLNGEGKIYSDAEMVQFIGEATAPLNAQINDLTNQVADLVGSNAALQSQVDAFAGQQEAAVTAAVSAVKADMLEKYEAQQVAESDSETGFVNYLKS